MPDSDLSVEVRLERAKREEAEAEVAKLRTIIKAYELSTRSSPAPPAG